MTSNYKLVGLYEDKEYELKPYRKVKYNSYLEYTLIAQEMMSNKININVPYLNDSIRYMERVEVRFNDECISFTNGTYTFIKRTDLI